MTTAGTILAQLGGNRFLAMTGARNLLNCSDALQFDLPRGSAKNKATKVRVTLTSADLYEVRFMRWNSRALLCDELGTVEDVYASDLRRVFTDATGLHCTL